MRNGGFTQIHKTLIKRGRRWILEWQCLYIQNISFSKQFIFAILWSSWDNKKLNNIAAKEIDRKESLEKLVISDLFYELEDN